MNPPMNQINNNHHSEKYNYNNNRSSCRNHSPSSSLYHHQPFTKTTTKHCTDDPLDNKNKNMKQLFFHSSFSKPFYLYNKNKNTNFSTTTTTCTTSGTNSNATVNSLIIPYSTIIRLTSSSSSSSSSSLLSLLYRNRGSTTSIHHQKPPQLLPPITLLNPFIHSDKNQNDYDISIRNQQQQNKRSFVLDDLQEWLFSFYSFNQQYFSNLELYYNNSSITNNDCWGRIKYCSCERITDFTIPTNPMEREKKKLLVREEYNRLMQQDQDNNNNNNNEKNNHESCLGCLIVGVGTCTGLSAYFAYIAYDTTTPPPSTISFPAWMISKSKLGTSSEAMTQAGSKAIMKATTTTTPSYQKPVYLLISASFFTLGLYRIYLG